MEQGSLLPVALDQAKRLRTTSANDSLLRNCIFLDLFCLGTDCLNKEEHLLNLARLAELSNKFFQSKAHFWHYGADGPVFGIHLDPSESVPHLRAYCRYGPSVQDGWITVRYAVEFIKSLQTNNIEMHVAARAWDVQDGQLILIQMADLLPSWLDEDPTDNHRHACWIDSDGNLQLFRKPHITLGDALRELARRHKPASLGRVRARSTSSHPKLQEALEYWLELNAEDASVHQRAPMVLPRTVANTFRERPELLRTAIQAFCEHIQHEGPETTRAQTTIEIDFTKHEDWVWTIQKMSRTNYAMARTVASSRGDWTSSPDSVPIAVGVEVKRYKRQCRSDASKHLKHAVSLGLRAVAGLEILLMGTADKEDGLFSASTKLSSLRDRIMFWDRVQQEYSGGNRNNNDDDASRTILTSFHKGPNNTELDLTNVLKCPVFPEEARNWTSYSNPQTSLREQIKSMLVSKKLNDGEERFWVPLPDQVDGEDWMECSSEKKGSLTAIDSQEGLNNLLSRFQLFLNKKSGVEGISSNDSKGNFNLDRDTPKRIEIRPRVFVNILHAVLKGDELDFPTIDPYFHQEDYDLAQDDSDSDDNDARYNAEESFQMKDIMVRQFSCLNEETTGPLLLRMLISPHFCAFNIGCYGQGARSKNRI